MGLLTMSGVDTLSFISYPRLKVSMCHSFFLTCSVFCTTSLLLASKSTNNRIIRIRLGKLTHCYRLIQQKIINISFTLISYNIKMPCTCYCSSNATISISNEPTLAGGMLTTLVSFSKSALASNGLLFQTSGPKLYSFDWVSLLLLHCLRPKETAVFNKLSHCGRQR